MVMIVPDLRLLRWLAGGSDELLIRMAARRMTRLMRCSECHKPVFREPEKWDFDAQQEFLAERTLLMRGEEFRGNMAEWERDVRILIERTGLLCDDCEQEHCYMQQDSELAPLSPSRQ